MAITGLHANSELVGVAWLKSLYPGWSAIVGTTVPGDNSSWAASGFIQVEVVGGSPEMYVPTAAPIFSIDCWAVNPRSGKPPWNKANNLAELVRAATYLATAKRAVTLPTNYPSARVQNVRMTSEPRRVRSDDASFARYSFDLEMRWIEA